MTDYSLTALQARRAASLDAGDMPAYYAFDCLIGAILRAPEEYERHNVAILKSREAASMAFRARVAEQEILDAYASEYARKNTRFDRECSLPDA